MTPARRVRPDGNRRPPLPRAGGDSAASRLSVDALEAPTRGLGERLGRTFAAAALAAFVAALVLATVAVSSSPADPPIPSTSTTTPAPADEPWKARYRRAQRRNVALHHRVHHLLRRLHVERRVMLSSPSVREAINLAGATYGYRATLWRKAACETGGTFSPNAYNRSSGASGLFQFMPSTWATTPYAPFSIWSPFANALAAGWMHAHGRGGEWACR